MKRMTKEELIALKPSTENPVVLEYIDNCFLDRTVIAATIAEYAFLSDEYLSIRNYSCITEYKSHKQPRYETLYECWDGIGASRLYNSEGRLPFFSEKRFSDGASIDALKRKTGRTAKLNLDTWEIEQ